MNLLVYENSTSWKLQKIRKKKIYKKKVVINHFFFFSEKKGRPDDKMKIQLY